MNVLSHFHVSPFACDEAARFASRDDPQEHAQPLDSFEYSRALRSVIHDRNVAEIERLKALIETTNGHAPAKNALSAIALRVEELQRSCMQQRTRLELCALRTQMLECETSIAQVREKGVRHVLDGCSFTARQMLRLLSIVRTVLDGNVDAALESLGSPGPQHVHRGEQEVLMCFDKSLLQAFAAIELCESVPVKKRAEAEATHSRYSYIDPEESMIQEWSFGRQVHVGGSYYSVSLPHMPLLQELSEFARVLGVIPLSWATLEKGIVEALREPETKELECLGLIAQGTLTDTGVRALKGMFSPLPAPRMPFPVYRNSRELELDLCF